MKRFFQQQHVGQAAVFPQSVELLVQSLGLGYLFLAGALHSLPFGVFPIQQLCPRVPVWYVGGL